MSAAKRAEPIADSRYRDVGEHARHRPPARPAPERRSLRFRPVEGARRGGRRARRRVARDYLGTSHRRDGVQSVVGRIRDGHQRPVRAARRLRSAARQRRLDALLGRRRVRPDRAAQLAPRARRVLVEVRRGHHGCARTSTRPRCSSPNPARYRRRSTRVEGDVYAYPHNETSTGVDRAAAPTGRGDALVVVDGDLGRGRHAAVAPERFDVYYFAPQKCFASDGGLWLACVSPARDRTRSSASQPSDALDPADARPRDRARQLAARPDLQHAGARDALPPRAPDRVDARATAASSGRSSRCATSAATVYGWADARPWATPFVKDPAYRSPVTATIDFEAPVDAAAIATTLRANGIVDVEPYRKLGRNQLRIALFPAIEPDDVVDAHARHRLHRRAPRRLSAEPSRFRETARRCCSSTSSTRSPAGTRTSSKRRSAPAGCPRSPATTTLGSSTT